MIQVRRALPLLVQNLRHARHALDGGCLLERQPRWFSGECTFGRAGILRQAAVIAGNLPKDFVTRFELCDILPGLFDSSGDIRAENRITGFSKPPYASIQRLPDQSLPVRAVDRNCMDLDQDFIVPGCWFFDLFQLENFG